MTSRRPADGSPGRAGSGALGVTVGEGDHGRRGGSASALEDAEVFLSADPAGVCLVPKDAWMGRPDSRVAVDVNAVPPLGARASKVTATRSIAAA